MHYNSGSSVVVHFIVPCFTSRRPIDVENDWERVSCSVSGPNGLYTRLTSNREQIMDDLSSDGLLVAEQELLVSGKSTLAIIHLSDDEVHKYGKVRFTLDYNGAMVGGVAISNVTTTSRFLKLGMLVKLHVIEVGGGGGNRLNFHGYWLVVICWLNRVLF